MKYRIFISSVQVEFAEERIALHRYVHEEMLLSQYFDVFVFENVPAKGQSPKEVYLQEVEQAAVYLALIGEQYGYEDEEGISPTEREYDRAKELHKERLVFIKELNGSKRHPKEEAFLQKINTENIRIKFDSLDVLKQNVYKACLQYLQEQGVLGRKAFDTEYHPESSLADIDKGKVKDFIIAAREKRNLKLRESTSAKELLTHFHLMHQDGRIGNSGLLAFGKTPQKFFPSSTIKCAHYHGLTKTKPIPDYKIFDGDVFSMIDAAYDFVLSKFSVAVIPTDEQVDAGIQYEIPPKAIRETIVNAVAHRSYISPASVHVIVYADRLEVSNPGGLSAPLSIERLHQDHASYPHNPRLAECLFQTAYIEKLGTGTTDILRLCEETQLRQPIFSLEEGFKAILWRPVSSDQAPTKHRSSTDDAQLSMEQLLLRLSTDQVPTKYRPSSVNIMAVVYYLVIPRSSKTLMQQLSLKHGPTFRSNYLLPAIEEKYVAATYPDNPRHPKQQYKLTNKGEALRERVSQMITSRK